MKLSIILPVKDSAKHLTNTLYSILADKNLRLSDYEIIVCNDGDTSEVNKVAEEFNTSGFHVFCERIPISMGSYNARNKGIERAKGDSLFFFDVPLDLKKGWFDDVILAFKENDYIAGNIKVPIEECTSISQKLYAATAFPVKSYFNNQHFGPTAFVCVKKEVFDKIGLFQTLYSGGDMEFGQRVYAAGFKMIFLENTIAWHHPRNLKQQFWKKVRAYAGIYAMHKADPAKRPFALKSLLSCLTAIPANIFKYRKNKIYQTGWLSFPEYVLAIFMFWGVEFWARIYVWLNRNKVLNT